MGAPSHFAAASLSMHISVRVEVYDSRQSASKKNGTPIAKFRMRSPASTTFGGLCAAVAERYMKESAGAIKTLPRIACVVDKEDCTFDMDDSIDIVVPNEAIRFVLEQTAQQQQQHQARSPVLSRTTQQPVGSLSRASPSLLQITGATVNNGNRPQIGATTEIEEDINAKTSAPQQHQKHQQLLTDVDIQARPEAQPRPSSSASRKPALLTKRLSGLSMTNATPASKPVESRQNPPTSLPITKPITQPPSRDVRTQVLSNGDRSGVTASGGNTVQAASSAKPVETLQRKRDPYEIDSESDANDVPSRQASHLKMQRRTISSSAVRPHTGMATNDKGLTATSTRSKQSTQDMLPEQALMGGQQSVTRSSVISVNGSSSSSSPVIVTPRRHYISAQRTESREQSRRQIEAGADVLSVYATDSNEVRVVTAPPSNGPFRHGNLTVQAGKQKQTPSHVNIVSVADSASSDEEHVSEETPAVSGCPSRRSLEKRSYHTVNEHIEIVDKNANSSTKKALPTPIMLKNSKGVFPVYRKGEVPRPGVTSDEEPAQPQPKGNTTNDPPMALVVNAEPALPAQVDLDDEFAGFDELSDFEVRPSARPVMSQPSHRTRTPSRSSLKAPREPTLSHSFESSIHPRSSPLESKQKRLTQPRKKVQPEPKNPTRLQAAEPLPKRGSNNRASRELSAATEQVTAESYPAQKKQITPVNSDCKDSEVTGAKIRRWVALRRASDSKPEQMGKGPTVTKPSSSKAAIRHVKSMTELKFGKKATESSIPDSLFAEDDVRDDFYDSELSEELNLHEDPEAEYVPKTTAPVSPQRSRFSRASSRRSSHSSHRSSTKRGSIPSSPFYPIDSIAVKSQKPEEPEPLQRFGRGYSKRVRQIFSDASESSDADTHAASDTGSHEKRVTIPCKPEMAKDRSDEVIDPQNSPSRHATSSPIYARSNPVSKPKPSSHPAWKPWWHPWGWINRYETVFLAGGIIGNGPFEGYELFNETPGTYIEDCEPPSEDLLAAEDKICKKDQFRLMCRRERRRERRLRGDYLEHEDDGYDSPVELAREFGEDEDLFEDFDRPMPVEISNSIDTGSEFESEDNQSGHEQDNEEPELPGPHIKNLENVDKEAPGDLDAADKIEVLTEEAPTPAEPVPQVGNTADLQARDTIMDERVAERMVRMERTRQYALTGEASSQSQEALTPPHDPAQLKRLARASTAPSNNSTTTSVLIARQLTCVSSPPSNQELAMLMSSSPSKRVDPYSVNHNDDASESSSETSSSIPAKLPSPERDNVSPEPHIEVPETPIKTRLMQNTKPDSLPTLRQPEICQSVGLSPEDQQSRHTCPPQTEAVTDAVRSALRLTGPKYKKLTPSSTRKAKKDLVVEIQALSPEQRAEYSTARPGSCLSPTKLRSFEDLNAIGNDVSIQKRASTPVITHDEDVELTGEGVFNDDFGSISPTVVARAKRRVTFGDEIDNNSAASPSSHRGLHLDSPSCKRSKMDNDGSSDVPTDLSLAKSRPAKPMRLPVISFTISDSEEDDDTSRSLEGLPNLVEDIKLRKTQALGADENQAQSSHAVTPISPPALPISRHDTSTRPHEHLSASQPLPIAHLKPRTETPIPPPIIPTSSRSDYYLTKTRKPPVIEIDSTEPSESNRDSDVVMVTKPDMPFRREKASSEARVQNQIHSTVKINTEAPSQTATQASPEEVKAADAPQNQPCVNSPQIEDSGLTQVTSDHRQGPKRARTRKKKQKRRSSGVSAVEQPPDHRLPHATAVASQHLLNSLARYTVQTSFIGHPDPTIESIHPNVARKRSRKSRRAKNTDLPSMHIGQKRRHRQGGQQEEQPGPEGHDQLSGNMLKDAAELAKASTKRRKLDHDRVSRDDDDCVSGTKGAALLPQSSSSAATNISSSHPSLISPPTTSRPSSAGS